MKELEKQLIMADEEELIKFEKKNNLPIHIAEPRWIPESFGKWIAVDFKFSDLFV